MEIRKVKCDVETCAEEYEEEFYNQGFPGWGHIVGGWINPETGAEIAHICPKHKALVKILLDGGLDHLLAPGIGIITI